MAASDKARKRMGGGIQLAPFIPTGLLWTVSTRAKFTWTLPPVQLTLGCPAPQTGIPSCAARRIFASKYVILDKLGHQTTIEEGILKGSRLAALKSRPTNPRRQPAPPRPRAMKEIGVSDPRRRLCILHLSKLAKGWGVSEQDASLLGQVVEQAGTEASFINNNLRVYEKQYTPFCKERKLDPLNMDNIHLKQFFYTSEASTVPRMRFDALNFLIRRFRLQVVCEPVIKPPTHTRDDEDENQAVPVGPEDDPMKVKAAAIKPKALRSERVTEKLALTELQDVEEARPETVSDYLLGLRSMIIALARAGRIPTESLIPESFDTSTLEYIVCQLDVPLAYYFKCEKAVLSNSGDKLQWLRTRDEDERSEWAYMLQKTPITIGNIILKVALERAAIWQAETLPRHPGRGTRPPHEPPAKRPRVDFAKHKTLPQKGSDQSYEHTDFLKDGASISKNWSRKQCKDPCPGRRLHVGNVLAKERACGMRNHCALDHRPNSSR
jgi:hypothetical protein